MWNEKQMFTVFGIEKVPADRGFQLGDCGRHVPQATNWQDATRAFIVVATRPEALRCFGEAMVGGDGWWWWLRAAGCSPEGEAVGPFLTSTQAYRNATSQQMTQPILPKLPMMKADRHRP
jgi:hypothetical protein